LKRKPLNIDELYDGVVAGDKALLSRAITLIESSLPDHRALARQLVTKCLSHSGESVRIGITGVPGVGKSTLIESFGNHLIKNENKKVAVLAIDPTSQISQGSILGDKTRMSKLSMEENAYIRPSAAGNSLGGVARNTRESIVLCEAAGYDVIMIETVGVGQSETTVRHLCDFFLLLMLHGAGDELQGIKRGIMEMADTIFINKAEDHDKEARLAAREYSSALHMMAAKKNGWSPNVLIGSGLEGRGIDKIWESISEFHGLTESNNWFSQNRKNQAKWWFNEHTRNVLLDSLKQMDNWREEERRLLKLIEENKISPFGAAEELIQSLFQP
jgi:LAO/AO transport system kinase